MARGITYKKGLPKVGIPLDNPPDNSSTYRVNIIEISTRFFSFDACFNLNEQCGGASLRLGRSKSFSKFSVRSQNKKANLLAFLFWLGD